MKVKVVEYVKPRGKREVGFRDIAGVNEDNYNDLCKLEIEVTVELLNTGMTSVCLDDGDGDYKMRIAKGTPEAVDEKIKELINEFDEEDYYEWQAIVNAVEPNLEMFLEKEEHHRGIN